MRFTLTKEEHQLLDKHRKDYSFLSTHVGRDGDVIALHEMASIRPDKIVYDFLKKRGIRRPIVEDAHVMAFGTVGMHTDNLYGDRYHTIIIPLFGKGELSHYPKLKNIYQHRVKCYSMESTMAIWLNDKLPHSYQNRSKYQTIAIVANCLVSQLKKIQCVKLTVN